ncbi:cell surface protein [Treponema primitia]|uniref:cell surface protein n=1 Tax=Treponema primitia TaxID=88058 RepID=UPI0002555310|nr:cell surface protein [Treponema primitia]
MRYIHLSAILILFGACATFSGNSETAGTESQELSVAKPRNTASSAPAPKNLTPMFTGDGGKGIVIAVPAPALENSTPANNWIPQFFQDLMTGDFARFSAMTVLDRVNESLTVAEQKLQENGNYSDEDYISIGHLTNAHYVVVGTIRSISGRYSVSFRINDIETNEIRASFNKQYSPQDVEGGLAAKETVQELLAGIGVVLTSEGERQLLAIPKIEVRASFQLARGMAAEQRNDSQVEALAYFYQAITTNPNMREANQHIENFANATPPSSIRERAEWALAQKAKWEKIWADLATYVNDNLLIVVYDFSTISDQFDARSNTVDITVTPGIKIIPNRTVLAVWKTVTDNWRNIKNLDENKSWANSVTMADGIIGPTHIGGSNSGQYTINVALYDDYGDRIALSRDIHNTNRDKVHFYGNRNTDLAAFQALAQIKYYNDASFYPLIFNRIKLDNVTDNLSAKVDSIKFRPLGGNPRDIPALLLSIPEWEQWLAEHGGR